MAFESFDNILRDVEPYVTSCGLPTIRNAIREAAIKLCRKSLVWNDYLGPINVFEDQVAYPLPTPRETEISMILNVYFSKSNMPLLTSKEITEKYPQYPKYYEEDGTEKVIKKKPMCAFTLSKNTINLAPVPDKDYPNALKLFVAYQPTLDAKGMDGDIIYHYYDVIRDGALHLLYLMPDKPWSQAERAQYHAKLFNYGCNKARASVNLGLSKAGSLKIDTRRVL